MAWFVIAAMAASAVASASQSSANAKSSAAWTEYNLKTSKVNADWRTREIELANNFERSMAMGMASINAENIFETAKINASMRQKAGAYNAQLLRNEAAVVWEQFELDELQFEKRLNQMSSNMRVAYGASGVMLDQDTPLQAEASLQTEGAMEMSVMRYNANLKASKLLDAAALGEWETEVAVNQIMYEGKMNAIGASYGSALQIGLRSLERTNQANIVQYNAATMGAKIAETGVHQASQYMQQSTNALVSGLFNTSSAVYSQYAQNRIDNTMPSFSSNTGHNSGYTDVMNYDFSYNINPEAISYNGYTAQLITQ